MREETRAALDALGVRIADLDAPVGRLSGGQRQAIAVARAVHSDARILLLDEPLAAMGARESAMVLETIERLRAQRRVSMILIVHNHTHVFQVCDRVCLLQNGRIALDRPVGETSLDELTELSVAEYRRARSEMLHGRSPSPNPRGA
jgi:ABC-type sugar transport system ATPase subunit